MISALRDRFLAASLQAASKRYLSPFSEGRDHVAEHWRDAIESAGVELVEVLVVRPDTKAVCLVNHPDWGKCVLKTVFTTRHPGLGLANRAIAETISHSAARIFPRVYAATDAYSLEEYIEGARFRPWMHERFEMSFVRDFLFGLKEWSSETSLSRSSQYLRPYEIQEICMSYIKKCFWLSRYASSFARLAAVRRLSSIGSGLSQRIERLVRDSEHVKIPRAMMCGDMGNVNLLVEKRTNRIYNIDYEYMSPGHWGFDCAYFVSSLRKMGDPEELVGPIESLAFSEAYLGSAECASFFTDYAAILRDVTRLVFRPVGRERNSPVGSKDGASLCSDC